MYYTIYQTTNLLNRKIYIGKHATVDPTDSYLGSGRVLRQAIAKYGRENFQKVVLFIFNNESDMDAKEAELVSDEFCLLESNYNLCAGGRGGFTFVNRNKLGKPNITRENRKKLEPLIKNGRQNMSPDQKAKHRKNLALAKKRYFAEGGTGPFKGNHHSSATKAAIGTATSRSSKGSGNSQYGTCWVYNQNGNRKIAKTEIEDYLKVGYIRGRLLKSKDEPTV